MVSPEHDKVIGGNGSMGMIGLLGRLANLTFGAVIAGLAIYLVWHVTNSTERLLMAHSQAVGQLASINTELSKVGFQLSSDYARIDSLNKEIRELRLEIQGLKDALRKYGAKLHSNGGGSYPGQRVIEEPLPPPQQVQLPIEIRTKVGGLVILQAKASGEVEFYVDERLAKEGEYYRSGNDLVLPSHRPGNYFVLAWTATNNKPSKASKCSVVVEGNDPSPIPPDPTPPTPEPFLRELQLAWAMDLSSPSALDHRAKLSAIYRSGVIAVDRPEIQTTGQLFETLRSAAQMVLPKGALSRCQQVIAGELAKRLGTNSSSPINRAEAKAAFTFIARSLDALK